MMEPSEAVMHKKQVIVGIRKAYRNNPFEIREFEVQRIVKLVGSRKTTSYIVPSSGNGPKACTVEYS